RTLIAAIALALGAIDGTAAAQPTVLLPTFFSPVPPEAAIAADRQGDRDRNGQTATERGATGNMPRVARSRGRGRRRSGVASSVNARGRRNGGFDRQEHVGERSLRTHLSIAQEQLAPLGRLAAALAYAAIDERPAVEVVIHVAREDEPVHQRRVEEQLLESLQRSEPDQIAAPYPHEIFSDVELPVLLRDVDVARDLDVARIADAQAVLVREADVVDRHRVEAHHLRRH